MSFSLPRTGRVRLDLFDVTGRRVATPLDVVREAGRRLKVVCEARREGGAVRAAVRARELAPDHAFFRLEGTSSALSITADLLGTITLVEEDPGLTTTAYGVLSDLLSLG